jgi:hypothetical protein
VREQIFRRPLKLRHTTITRTALMPDPALHAYGTDRGPYEDTTSWSPSWGLGRSQPMVSTTYLPQERLAISIVSTLAPSASFDGRNPSEVVLARWADTLASGHPVHLPSTS